MLNKNKFMFPLDEVVNIGAFINTMNKLSTKTFILTTEIRYSIYARNFVPQFPTNFTIVILQNS